MDYNYENIVDYATAHTGVSITYADALKYVQKRRNEIVENIRAKLWENFFYKTYYTDIVSGTNQYDIPTSSSTDGRIINIKRIEVKEKSTNTYRTYIPWNIREIESTDYLETESPYIYEIRNNSIFLYPTPTESITAWLFIEWEVNLPDITVSSVELDIFGWHTEMRQFIQLISDWLCADLYSSNRQYQDKAIAEQDFQISLSRMIRNISDRWNSIITQQEADLYQLE